MPYVCTVLATYPDATAFASLRDLYRDAAGLHAGSVRGDLLAIARTPTLEPDDTDTAGLIDGARSSGLSTVAACCYMPAHASDAPRFTFIAADTVAGVLADAAHDEPSGPPASTVRYALFIDTATPEARTILLRFAPA